MCKHFGKPKDPVTTQLVVWICSIAPDAVADFGPVLEVADTLVAQGRTWHHLYARGPAYYRAGQYEAAVRHLDEARKVHPQDGNAYTWLFLAMAHQRLGQTERAREWLAKSLEWIEQAMKGKIQDPFFASPLPWHESFQLRVLSREAKALLEGK